MPLDHWDRQKRSTHSWIKKVWQSFLLLNASISALRAVISLFYLIISLQDLFQETSDIPILASARIQRWALIFGAYDYAIQYKPGTTHANADVFSHLPLPDTPRTVPLPSETTLTLNMLESLPVTADQIRKWTARDLTLSKVRLLLSSGWDKTDQSDLAPYQQRQTELSLHDGCVFWGSRVVVPPPGRERILDELHEGHPGISRMKSLARSFVWWPGLDNSLEQKVKTCDACQRSKIIPAIAPIQPWEWPECPWSRLHGGTAVWTHVPSSCRCAFEVDGSQDGQECHFLHHHHCPTVDLCCSWYTRAPGLRQWLCVHQCGIQELYPTQWHSPRHLRAVSPSNEWFSRTSSTDFQVLPKKDS